MRIRIIVTVATAMVLLSACAPTAVPTTIPTSTSAVPSPSPTPTIDPIAGLTLRQRVGQLFMVGTGTGRADPGTRAAVSDRDVGGVFLHSGTRSSVAATASIVDRFTALVPPGGVPLWVATDQEGGEVQVLSGPGFAAIPAAREQGTLDPATLRADAADWGGELIDAGVDVNLAPVADIVTSAETAGQNKPIGALHRQYGYDRQSVAAGAGAFADGMRQAGVMPTFKHFPGLGRTPSNTDFGPAFDTVVDADSPDVQVYRDLLGSGPALVMVSTAVYKKLDAHAPAAFSTAIVTGLLRERLGFDGVVITDDLSAAASVEGVSPANRAVEAIEAGCDIVLVSSGPALLPEMYDAVLAKASSDPSFARRVDAAARRVVAAKRAGP